jgi:hypothetical protein
MSEQVSGQVSERGEAAMRYEPPMIERLDVLGVLVRGASGNRFDDLTSCTAGSDFDDDGGAC